jgi:alpha-beta hydrolase superfamily lysophospholipase
MLTAGCRLPTGGKELCHYEWFWQADDGIKIFAQGWEPAGDVAGAICLVHGHGDHSGRYAHVAAALAEAGYATITFDHRGHGKSGGNRGYTPSYDALLNDVAHALGEAERRYPGRPRFLYGQSMGGNLVLNYALRRRPPIAGVIATSPWLRLAFDPPAWRLALARVTDRILPALAQPSGLDIAAITRDPAAVRAYADDPLNHDRITPRLFHGVYAAGLWALAHAAEFPLPLLLMHGSADRITSAAASQEFAARAPDCTFRLWEGCYHEVHNEPEQVEMFATIIDWLRAHTPHVATS